MRSSTIFAPPDEVDDPYLMLNYPTTSTSLSHSPPKATTIIDTVSLL